MITDKCFILHHKLLKKLPNRNQFILGKLLKFMVET